MEATATQTQEISVFEKSLTVLKDAGEILNRHKSSAANSISAGQKLIDKFQLTGKMTAELDAECMNYMVKVNKTLSRMKEDRAPVTQIADALKKMYTENENLIDPSKSTIPATVQGMRNTWAAEVIKENERIKKEQEAKAAHEKMKADFRAWIQETITSKLLNYLHEKKKSLTESFNQFTLENFEDKSAKLQAMTTGFPIAKLAEIIAYTFPTQFSSISTEEFVDIQNAVKSTYDFQGFYTQYQTDILDLKKTFIDRLPSLKAELQDAFNKAEAARIAQEEEQKRAAEAARLRQIEIEKAAGERRKQMEEEARLAKIADEKRMEELRQQQAQEAERMAAEKQRREKEEADRLAKEDADRQKAAAEAAELTRAQGTAMALFNEQADSAALLNSEPEARTSFEIEVKHMAGWAEIFQFYYIKNATTLTIEDMGKKSLNQMKTFAESAAKKDGKEKIVSKCLVYNTVAKAVNRKA